MYAYVVYVCVCGVCIRKLIGAYVSGKILEDSLSRKGYLPLAVSASSNDTQLTSKRRNPLFWHSNTKYIKEKQHSNLNFEIDDVSQSHTHLEG